MADSTPPPLTGTVVETASFGLPSLPATGNPTSLSSLLTGSHTIRVWYASPGHFRLAVPQSLSESDVIRDGRTAWLWQSTLNKVTKFTLPAHAAENAPGPFPSSRSRRSRRLSRCWPRSGRPPRSGWTAT